MITLYGFGLGFGLPESSPYVTKTEVQLKMAGLPFVKRMGSREESPKGQLPYISDNSELISDSTFIRAHIEETHGIDLDEGLDVRGRAEAWAIERMLENHFGWISGYYRWLIPDNFDKGPAHFFDEAPEHIREKIRIDALQKVSDRIFAVGITRHKPEEIAWLGERSLEALSAILGDQSYLMGGKPSGVDATAFAFLAGVLAPFFISPIREKAESLPNLVDYTSRMMKRYYPEFDWQGGRKPAAVREFEWG